MNYRMLEKVICDTIKEEQIKLGYEKETIRLYYPMSSLAHILEEKFENAEQLTEALKTFAEQVKDKLGKLMITHTDERFCILIPPEGAAYVHENIEDNPFLIDFIAAVRNHACTIEQLLSVFHKYSDQVVCININLDDFDYVIYFDEGKMDDYRYCIKFEQGHTVYHRFTKKDFEQFGFITEEQQSEPEEVIDEEKEQTYQKLLRLMKAVKCMTAGNDKIDMYKKLAKKFIALSGYKASAECAEECKQLAKQARKDMKKKLYKAALKMKEEARNAEEYREAGEKFRKISGYKDSDDLAIECDLLSHRLERRFVKKRIISLGILILCGIFIIIAAVIPQTKYVLARINQSIASYENAIKLYQKSAVYGDSEERLIQCRYQYGLKLMAEKQYAAAVKYFNSVGRYKDADQKMVEAEKLQIRNSAPGDTIQIGNGSWLLLETKEQRALLIKKKPIKARPYHEQRTEITWEKCSLRQWLNSEYRESSFSEAEKNNLIITEITNEDNFSYHTKGGNNTQDILFILSISEVEKYLSLLPDSKSNTWLRSPGSQQDSAAFLSADGSVMDYGYDVSSSELKLLPLMWFSIAD
jgi:tetratricopeptide (TPR) repeat protein